MMASASPLFRVRVTVRSPGYRTIILSFDPSESTLDELVEKASRRIGLVDKIHKYALFLIPLDPNDRPEPNGQLVRFDEIVDIQNGDVLMLQRAYQEEIKIEDTDEEDKKIKTEGTETEVKNSSAAGEDASVHPPNSEQENISNGKGIKTEDTVDNVNIKIENTESEMIVIDLTVGEDEDERVLPTTNSEQETANDSSVKPQSDAGHPADSSKYASHQTPFQAAQENQTTGIAAVITPSPPSLGKRRSYADDTPCSKRVAKPQQDASKKEVPFCSTTQQSDIDSAGISRNSYQSDSDPALEPSNDLEWLSSARKQCPSVEWACTGSSNDGSPQTPSQVGQTRQTTKTGVAEGSTVSGGCLQHCSDEDAWNHDADDEEESNYRQFDVRKGTAGSFVIPHQKDYESDPLKVAFKTSGHRYSVAATSVEDTSSSFAAHSTENLVDRNSTALLKVSQSKRRSDSDSSESEFDDLSSDGTDSEDSDYCPINKKTKQKRKPEKYFKNATIKVVMKESKNPVCPGTDINDLIDGGIPLEEEHLTNDESKEREATKQRIMKLLDTGLHEESNEHEMRKAMRIAQNLMRKHNLSMARMMKERELRDNGVVPFKAGFVSLSVKHRRPPKSRELSTWILSLMMAVATTFDVKCFTSSICQVTFYGFKHSSQLAAFAFKCSAEKISAMIFEYPSTVGARNATGTNKLSYGEGIADSLLKTAEKENAKTRREEAQDNGSQHRMALVVADMSKQAQDQFKKENNIDEGLVPINARKAAAMDKTSWLAGKKAAKSINLKQRSIKNM